jgi:hypothetical protein
MAAFALAAFSLPAEALLERRLPLLNIQSKHLQLIMIAFASSNPLQFHNAFKNAGGKKVPKSELLILCE